MNECLLKCVLQQWVSGQEQVEIESRRSQEEQGGGGDGMIWKERRVLKQQAEEQRQEDGKMVALEGVKRADEAEMIQ